MEANGTEYIEVHLNLNLALHGQ